MEDTARIYGVASFWVSIAIWAVKMLPIWRLLVTVYGLLQPSPMAMSFTAVHLPLCNGIDKRYETGGIGFGILQL